MSLQLPRGVELLLRVGPLVVSLGALGVSFEALRRSEAPRVEVVAEPSTTITEPPRHESAEGARRPFASESSTRPAPSPAFSSAPRSSPAVSPSPAAPLLASRLGSPRAPSKPVPEALASLAATLRVRPDSLANLADASGELPAPIQARLLHAQAAGVALATGAHLDGVKGDAVANILVDYVIRTAREVDLAAAPSEEQAAVIKQDALAAIRATAGADLEPAAGAAIDGL